MKKVLIVVDMQKGFTQYGQTKELVGTIEGLLSKSYFDVVIGTRFINYPDSMFERLFGWTKMETNEEIEIPAELVRYMDFVEDKYVYNCVNLNFIQKLMQVNDGMLPEQVYVVGVDTDCCVLATATALFENNIRPVVLTKYCASNGGTEAHQAGIMCLKRLIGERQLVNKENL